MALESAPAPASETARVPAGVLALRTRCPRAVRPDKPSPLPPWVRLLDAATTLVAGIGLLLEITGGPRFTVAGLPVSMASGTRPLLLAAGLALVRHVLVRRDPLHRRLLRAWGRRPQSTFTRSILPAFLTTRVAVLLIGYLAVRTIGFAPGGPAPAGASADGLGNLLLRWDAGWYYQIADVGYRFDPADPAQQNIAFFPAYPLLMRYVALLFGGRLLLAGLLVSLGAFLGAMAYLFQLARQFMDDDHAAAAVVLLASYPFAVFYGAVYTESVFLLAMVGAFYHLGRGECGRAAAWGLLAGLTRPNGFLLSLPLLLVALQPHLLARTGPAWRWVWEGRSPGPSSTRSSGATSLPVSLAAAVMPVPRDADVRRLPVVPDGGRAGVAPRPGCVGQECPGVRGRRVRPVPPAHRVRDPGLDSHHAVRNAQLDGRGLRHCGRLARDAALRPRVTGRSSRSISRCRWRPAGCSRWAA